MQVYPQWFQFTYDLDKEHCRPFDASRAGLNLGEGAGYIVLQSEKLLRKEPYCLLSGYSNVNEAFIRPAVHPKETDHSGL